MTDPDGYDADAGALTWWHPVDDEPMGAEHLSWGEVAPGSSADLTVRLCNTRDDYTASGITVAVGDPLDPDAASAAAGHLVSADGQTFAATCTIDDLPPGAVSNPITLRRITLPDADDHTTMGFTLAAAAAAWLPVTAAAEPTTAPVDAGDMYDPDTAQPPVDDPQETM